MPSESRFASKLSLAAGIGLIAVIASVSLIDFKLMPAEYRTTNWKHVERARAETERNGFDYLVHIDKQGKATPVPYLDFSQDDVDVDLRESLKAIVATEDTAKVEEAFAASHEIPAAHSDSEASVLIQAPELSVDVFNAIDAGYADFLRISLSDACLADGDVVKIIINEKPFAVIPLTKQNATLSVPVVSLPTSIELQGVADGGGGITVGFETSQGQYFARVVEVGETVLVGLLE